MYLKEEIYQALLNIFHDLKVWKVSIIINEGDVFVSCCMDKNIDVELFDGINQESVFKKLISILKSI